MADQRPPGQATGKLPRSEQEITGKQRASRKANLQQVASKQRGSGPQASGKGPARSRQRLGTQQRAAGPGPGSGTLDDVQGRPVGPCHPLNADSLLCIPIPKCQDRAITSVGTESHVLQPRDARSISVGHGGARSSEPRWPFWPSRCNLGRGVPSLAPPQPNEM